MAYVKLASFAVFLLAAFLMFPMKKIEGAKCGMPCNVQFDVCDSDDCFCYSEEAFSGNGNCVTFTPFKEKVEEHPNLCQTHSECTKKGSGNFCARFPNSNRKYGFCFACVSEAKDAFKMASSYKFKNDFLKMYVPSMKKMVEENPNLCQSDTECRNKGSGNYCARFPNSDLKYGWCFASISEAEDAFKMASSYKFNKDFLKMSLPA